MKTSKFFNLLSLLFLFISVIHAQKSKSIEIVQGYFKAVDGGDENKINSLLTPDFKAEAPISPVPINAESWSKVCLGFKAGFSDLKHQVIHIFSDGNQVAVQGKLQGINNGSFMGKPATGNKVDIAFNTLFTVNKTRITAIHSQFDFQGFLDQLNGISPTVKMNIQNNVRALFAAMDAGQVDEFVRYCSSDFKITNPFLASAMPIQAFQGIIQAQRSAFPDMQHVILDMVSSGKTVITKGIFTGTNLGNLMGNPPTGNKVNIPFLVWDDLDAAGMITNRNVQFDNKAFQSQLMDKMISSEYMKSTVKASYDALSKHDFDRFASYLSDQSVDYATPMPTKGKDAIVGSIKEFFSAFPDYEITVDDIAVSGNKVFVQNTFHAKHTQTLLGMIPPTGKKVSWSDVDIMEFDENGKIYAHWANNNNAPLDQIGYHSITNPNTGIVMDAYDKFGKGDIPGLTELCSDKISWDVEDNPQLKSPKIYKGKKEVMQFFADLTSLCEITKFEPVRFLADGEEVLVVNLVEWKTKATHKSWSTTLIHHIKVENGKIVSFKELAGKVWPVVVSAAK